MSDIQFQISRPVYNSDDGQFHHRTRWVYDSDGDGVLESHGERIWSADDAATMLDPSYANRAPQMVQDLMQVATEVAAAAQTRAPQ